MTAADLTINPDWVHYGNYSYQSGQQLYQQVQGQSLTAIVAGSDMVAVGLIKAAQQAGTQVPEQLSVVGIDGALAGEIVSPELTTVKQDFFRMGTTSVDNLLNDQAATFIPTRLVKRASVAKL